MKAEGICVFCNGKGMSKQHMWPDWLKNVIPRHETKRLQTNVRTELVAESTYAIKSEFNAKQGHVGVTKIRRVCKTCNNGWMSVLETKAMPYLTALILGENLELTKEIQLVLLKWVVMTTIVAEYTDLPTLAISDTDRNYFMETKLPPEKWKIWIGRYKGEDWKQRYYHSGLAIATRDEFSIMGRPASANFQSSTFVVGELLLLIVSTTYSGVDLNSLDNELSEKLICIWPLNDEFNWHQLEINSDNEINVISRYFPLKFYK